RDWSSDVCSSDLLAALITLAAGAKYEAPTAAGIAAAACVVLAIALGVATAVRRELVAPILGGALTLGSIVVAALVLGASVAAPGYAADPATGVPVGEAMPAALRP